MRVFVLASFVVVVLARSHRSLPTGKLIVAYAPTCNASIIFREVKAGVNVLIWFSISLGSSTTLGELGPAIIGGPNTTCVAKVRSLLDAAGYNDVAHLISIGGWNAPHPNTSVADGSRWWTFFEKWNVNPMDSRQPLYDGIDWDLEGNDDMHSRYNHFSLACLYLVHDMSKAAKEAGAIVSLVPPQSYFDVTSNTFDRSLLHHYSDWHPEFNYHGRNSYLPFLVWNASLYDFVDIQFYETWSRAAQAVEQQSRSPASYLAKWIRQVTNGSWHVNFSGDPGIGINRTVAINIPPERLVLGFSRGGGAQQPAKSVFIHPEFIGDAFAALSVSEKPRGCMFWEADLDGRPCWSPNGSVSFCNFASGFNAFLHTRPLRTEGVVYV